MYNNRVSPDPDPQQSRTRSGSTDLDIHSSLGSFTVSDIEGKTDTGQMSPQGQSQNEQNQEIEILQHSDETPGGESKEDVEGKSWGQDPNRSDDQGGNNKEMGQTPGHYREIDNNSRLSDIDDKTALILPDESTIYKDKKSYTDSPKVALAVKRQLNQEDELFEMQPTESYVQRETEKKAYLEAAEKKKHTKTDQKHRQRSDREEKTSYHEVIIGGGEEGEGEIGCCGWILTILSCAIVILTVPFSMFFCIKVVQEYERAVIFRLGRLLSGGAKGPDMGKVKLSCGKVDFLL